MNIKNEETQRLVRELATLTGESQTTAITKAVRERLEKVRNEQDGEFVERLLAIGRDCAAHMTEGQKAVDHGELLYDEEGLFK